MTTSPSSHVSNPSDLVGDEPSSPAPTREAFTQPQREFLLRKLFAAKDHALSIGDVNKRLKGKEAADLGLRPESTEHLGAALAAEHLLRIVKAGRTSRYELTEQGRAHVQALGVAAGTARGTIRQAKDEAQQRQRKSFLLYQLLKAKGRTLSQRTANTANATWKHLNLNAATAHHIRAELAAEGLLTVAREGKKEKYTLTPAGQLRLGTMEFYDKGTFTLTGTILNQLLEAARDAAKQFDAPAPVHPTPRQAPADLAAAVLAEFEELRREKHHHSGMVPIHEVRQRIREKYGEESARHGVLDEVIKGLHRDGQLRLAALTDQGRATEEELQGSLPGVGETLFYLETVREHAVL
jgi:predicted transcriptional regulator